MRLGLFSRLAFAGAIWWLAASTPILISRDMAGEAKTQEWVYESCLKNAYGGDENGVKWCDEQSSPSMHPIPLNLPARAIAALSWSIPWMAIGLVVYVMLILTARWVLAGRQKI